MTFAETLMLLRSDGYHDAADLLEEQAHQILIFRQAMLENEALKKQLKVLAEDKAYYQEQLTKVQQDHDTLDILLHSVKDDLELAILERNEAWEAICDHCQDIPCQQQDCYWYRKQYETANTEESAS